MTKFKKVLFGVIGMFILGAMPLAHAQGLSGPQGEDLQRRVDQRYQEIYKQLNLTDDQKKQLDENKKEHRARMHNDLQEMKDYKEAFKEELMKPQFNFAKVKELHNRIKSVQAQIEDDKLRSILVVRTILTPEQFTKFVSLAHQHKQDHNK